MNRHARLGAAALLMGTFAWANGQAYKFTPNDAAEGDKFGHCVAAFGSFAVVGAPWDDNVAVGAGSVYLLDITNPSSPTQVAKILPPDGAYRDHFGHSVDIDGDLVIVGAPNDDDNGDASGSVYIFNIVDPDNPTFVSKIHPNDSGERDFFGQSVGISGSTAIVGAVSDSLNNGGSQGAAYLFDLADAANPVQIARLQSNSPATRDAFGFSVAISGTSAVVGAWGDDENGDDSGLVYLFETTIGFRYAMIVPTVGAVNERFGVSVSISDSLVVVGSMYDDDNDRLAGSAYVFDANSAQLRRKLLVCDFDDYAWFGYSVAIDGNNIVAGAPLDLDPGSVYVLDTNSGRQLFKIHEEALTHSQLLGWSVAITADAVIGGAPSDRDNGEHSGAVYLLDLSNQTPCSNLADVTTQGVGGEHPRFGIPDCLVTASDINYFVNAWVADDLITADLTTQGAAIGDGLYGTPDGIVTAADISYYVSAWVQEWPDCSP